MIFLKFKKKLNILKIRKINIKVKNIKKKMHNSNSESDAVQTDVNVILTRALLLSRKKNYSELTLVEILDSYDSIVYEDD